jgi:hypothetical protein
MLLTAAAILLQLGPVALASDADLLREARRAQNRFELFRRTHLPWQRSNASLSRCDTRVGRYCYWYDTTITDVVPEPKSIGEARGKLLGLLDSASARNGADQWVAGQRIRYLIEADRLAEAFAAARSCTAERSWCLALEGLALHVAERYAESDSVYDVAIGAMGPAQLCEWFDLSLILDGPVERQLSRASCETRRALANRLWTLAQPLWSIAGNDLRTEYFARRTMASILARSDNAHGIAWSGDSRELLLRYGWAEWFTRSLDDYAGSLSASPKVTGHDREPSYQFLPDISSLEGIPRISAASWKLRDPFALTRYAPRHLKRMVDLRHQLSRFPRGDSMLVAASYRIADTALARDSLIPRMAVLHNGRIVIVEGDSQRVLMMVPRDTVIASVEVRGARSKHVARTRLTVEPLPRVGAWQLSDLLLFDASRARVPASVDSVVSGALDPSFRNVTPLGVYWEIAGLADDPVPVSLSLTVTPVRVSVGRRLATRLKLAPQLAPVRLHWPSTVRRGHVGEHVVLRLPRSARGQYRVLLTLDVPGVGTLSSQRDIELLP